MRTFQLPKIKVRKPEFITTSSLSFIKDNIPFKKVHFQSRDGIVEVAQTPPDWVMGPVQRAKAKNPNADEKVIINRVLEEKRRPTKAVSRFVLALHSAFAKHIPFTLSPEVVMMLISQEVAQYSKDYSKREEVSRLFTKVPDEKEEINVEVDHFVYGSPENDWLESMEGFRTQLVEKIPSGILEYLTPKLSGGTLETHIAHLVSFMDAASSYYGYGMSTLCGVPAFRLEGVADDWQSILQSVEKMEELLPGLNLYFSNLKPILREIRNTVDGNRVDNDFWASIYKENNESGGPYSNGWFNNFFAHLKVRDYKTGAIESVLKDKEGQFKHTLMNTESYSDEEGYQKAFRHLNGFNGSKLNNFPTNISSVPFIWNYLGNKIPMNFIAGVIGVEMVSGYLTPKLGVTIVEI